MAYNTMPGESACSCQLKPLWVELHSIRPDYDSTDVQRARPYLYLISTRHIQQDGSFDSAFVDSGDLKRLYSFVPQEDYLRQSEIEEMNKIIDRTIEVKLMREDFTWNPMATKTQIALWVDEMASRFPIQNKWKWAEERWEIKNLKQARSSTLTRYCSLRHEEWVRMCFADEAK